MLKIFLCGVCVSMQASIHTFCKTVLNFSLPVLKCQEYPKLTEAHSLIQLTVETQTPPLQPGSQLPPGWCPASPESTTFCHSPEEDSNPRIKMKFHLTHTASDQREIISHLPNCHKSAHLLKYVGTAVQGSHC